MNETPTEDELVQPDKCCSGECTKTRDDGQCPIVTTFDDFLDALTYYNKNRTYAAATSARKHASTLSKMLKNVRKDIQSSKLKDIADRKAARVAAATSAPAPE